MDLQTIIHNEQETKKMGEEISRLLSGGDILCLEGNLGAGKTTLVKGLAKALGIKKNITSPTFALMNIYECPAKKTKQKFDTKLAIKKLAHIDTYRLKNEEELIDIGIEDYLGAPDTLCVIEWPERITGLLKNKKIKKIRIEHAENNERILAVKK